MFVYGKDLIDPFNNITATFVQKYRGRRPKWMKGSIVFEYLPDKTTLWHFQLMFHCN